MIALVVADVLDARRLPRCAHPRPAHSRACCAWPGCPGGTAALAIAVDDAAGPPSSPGGRPRQHVLRRRPDGGGGWTWEASGHLIW